MCAHELGHCLVDISKHNSSSEIEYEADKFGYKLFLDINSKLCPNYKDDHLLGAFSYSAPFLFFVLCEAFEKYDSDENVTHPSAQNRAKSLVNMVKTHYNKEHIELGDSFISQLSEMVKI